MKTLWRKINSSLAAVLCKKFTFIFQFCFELKLIYHLSETYCFTGNQSTLISCISVLPLVTALQQIILCKDCNKPQPISSKVKKKTHFSTKLVFFIISACDQTVVMYLASCIFTAACLERHSFSLRCALNVVLPSELKDVFSKNPWN